MAEKITKIDSNADGFKYIGEANQGTADGDDAWLITRVSSGNPQVIDVSDHGVKWTDRTTSNYS